MSNIVALRHELENYIKKWNEIEGIKPKNEPGFLNPFLNILREINFEEDGEFEFDGNGSYGGKQITICFEYTGRGWGSTYLRFEISYSQKKCSIYTADHNGFWTPEYAILDGQIWNEIRPVLFNQISKCVGILTNC